MASEPAPTSGDDRIGMLDTTRGIAVLGILLMNITGFGLPNAYDNPTVWGVESPIDMTVWRVTTLLFEGTMRGLFTLLFGASALLFLRRQIAESPGLRPADLYFRRTLWLIAFGLLNGYVLLWSGDVLFFYGIAGLALFVFRDLSPRRLILLATAVMLLQTTVSVVEWHELRESQQHAQAAEARQAAGQPLTADEQAAIAAFAALKAEFKPSREDLQASVENIRDSYAAAFWVLSGYTWFIETDLFPRHALFESVGMMLLGMALLKLGIVSGQAATRTYLMMIVVGYSIGLSVNVWEMRLLERFDFAPEVLMRTTITYDLGRIPMTLGHLAAIGLICRTQWLKETSRLLAAVGRMALTNYLAQSAMAMFLFTGAGLAWYGQMSRHELYYIVFAIWIVQLLWSALWLKHFRYGPAEWLWRSLTHGRWQRLRHTTGSAAQVSTPT